MTLRQHEQRQTVLRIAAGGTTSAHFELMNRKPTAVMVPANFTGTSLTITAAPYTLDPSRPDGCGPGPSAFTPALSAAGQAMTLQAGPGRAIALQPGASQGLPFIRFVADAAQLIDTDLILIHGA
ncbi:MAG: hypothetical protein K2X11_02580 [Acetobacteraceae bacterium]|nr:hypothetical protein [Acetobacteraceae bacterium]